MYTACSLAGLGPALFRAVTQNSYWAFGKRFVTEQYVSLTVIVNAEKEKKDKNSTLKSARLVVLNLPTVDYRIGRKLPPSLHAHSSAGCSVSPASP